MGYDTSLEIGDRTGLMWRKYASPLPRLLFQHDQAYVRANYPAATSDPDDAWTPELDVGYEATASQVLATLDEAGLGWAAAVAAYSEIRVEAGFTAGFVIGHATGDGADVDDAMDAFVAVPPETDLVDFSKTLAAMWADEALDEIPIFENITHDGIVESGLGVAAKIQRYANENLVSVNAFAAARAAESWTVLHSEAPLLAWPMLICALLHELPASTVVSLDLSYSAAEEECVTVEEGKRYCETYWESATEGLASSARTLGRLFTALAAFDSKLGREFWFARAAILYDRLDALKAPTNDGTSKQIGDALEDLVEALLRTEEPELQVVERNFRTAEEEIDIVVSNGLSDPFWTSHGSPLILIECKNTSAPIGVPDLRIFESKILDRSALCRIGVFVSFSGFAETFLTRLKSFQKDGIIFAVSGVDVRELVTSKTRLSEWLRGPGVIRSLGK